MSKVRHMPLVECFQKGAKLNKDFWNVDCIIIIIIIIILSCLTSLDSSKPIQKRISVNHEGLSQGPSAHLLQHSRNNSSRNKDAYEKESTLENNKNPQAS